MIFYPSFKLIQTHQILKALFGDPKRYEDGVVVYQLPVIVGGDDAWSILEDNAYRVYLGFCWFAILSAASLGVVMHPRGNRWWGELGGWFWRQWWHYSEVKALEQEDFGLWVP